MAYLVACWWWIRRKRVRARARFAPLLATSPLAYQMVIAADEPLLDALPDEGPPIIALIDIRKATTKEGAALDDTLDSVSAEGMMSIVIGTGDTPDIAAAARQINWGVGAWLMPVAPGDMIAIGAARAYRRAMAAAGARLIYADDDLRTLRGLRHSPHLKPQWNAELYRHFDYLTGACIVRAAASNLIDPPDGDWARSLVTAIAGDHGAVPLHIPRVLHHRLSRPQPKVPTALRVTDASLPAVSVIIPIRNKLALLRVCLEGLDRTHYPDMEVLIVDNGSDDPATLRFLDALPSSGRRVLRMPGPFNFAALNNDAVVEAKGHLLCLLNNDIEVLEPDWLRTMACQALRPDVGAVGARLLYPDRRIQHAGVVMGIGNAAGHAHRRLRWDEDGYFQRHAVPQFVSAVTAACLVVQRSHYDAVGGLDRECFPVAFNDVDFCLRLNQRGWRSLYEPRATLIHHESVSRGVDRDPVGAARFARELAALQHRWGTERIVDPYHHPRLSKVSERFVLELNRS